MERTYGWLKPHRRLARDCETLPTRSDSMIHIAMTSLMSRAHRRTLFTGVPRRITKRLILG